MSTNRTQPTSAGKRPATKPASIAPPLNTETTDGDGADTHASDEHESDKQDTIKPASDKPAGNDASAFFDGKEAHRRLKAFPKPEELADAREHIKNLILHGGKPDSSNPRGQDVAMRTAIEQAHFLFSIEQSLEHLPRYATLDFEHIKHIIDFTKSVHDYALDRNRKQPINFVMLASPGEGKSHFIDCIAEKLDGSVGKVLFNMASMRRSDDLASALDRAHNITVEGKVPLLFLDEFDSDAKNYSLLLPLLWDGEIELGAHKLSSGGQSLCWPVVTPPCLTCWHKLQA